MNETQDKIGGKAYKPHPAQPAPKQSPELEAKRAQNLRDNLLKRKQQARARAAEEPKN